jgi:hypothetical protein
MRRTLVLTLGLAALLSGTAAAKGPTAVTITGPGLDDPVELAGDAEGNTSSRIGRLVEGSGWFAQAFQQTPDSTSRTRPEGRLGARYDAVWSVPGPDGKTRTIKQQLYPFAAAGPVTYVAPNQTLFPSEGMTTHGGWFRAPVALRPMLAALGLPKRAPALSESGLGAGAWAVISAGIALALGAATTFVAHCRRSGQAPA